MVENKCIAIIPARGGSKRIPKKNIIDLNGKPMIAYTIEAALKTGLFSKVMVSTDNQEIADIAMEYGAWVPFLRDDFADDHSPISVVTANELVRLAEIGEQFDHVVQLMANCPIRGANEIVEAYTYFNSAKHKFQLSCFQYGWMNPWWAHTLSVEGIAKPVFDDEIRTRRSQDQPELFCPTGAIWIADVKELIETKSFYGDGYRFFPMTWQSAIDIDNYEDLAMAKLMLMNG